MFALQLLGIALFITGPVLVIIVLGLRKEKQRNQRETAIRREGSLVHARLISLGRSPVSASYPGGSVFLRLELSLQVPGTVGTSVVTLEQTVPKIVMGALVPGATLQARVRSLGGEIQAIVDYEAMGYR